MVKKKKEKTTATKKKKYHQIKLSTFGFGLDGFKLSKQLVTSRSQIFTKLDKSHWH